MRIFSKSLLRGLCRYTEWIAVALIDPGLFDGVSPAVLARGVLRLLARPDEDEGSPGWTRKPGSRSKPGNWL